MATDDVEQFADCQAITDVFYLYCRAMDRKGLELAYAVWYNGGVAEYGAFSKGTGREFVDKVFGAHEGLVAHSHQVANILLALDGDQVSSEAYFTAALRDMQDEVLVERTSRGRYANQWSRRDGQWVIDKRLCIHDFDDARPVLDEAFSGLAPRDRTDPSYAVFQPIGVAQ